MKYLVSLFAFLSGLLILSSHGWAKADYHPSCVTTVTSVVVGDTCGRGGSIVLSHNGTAPFTYDWSHDVMLDDSIALGLEGGTVYSVTVNDDAGCSVTELVFVPAFSPINVNGSTTPDTCGGGVGVASVPLGAISGGTPPYTYQWDAAADSQVSPSAINLTAGVYTVTITDADGCQTTWAGIVGDETTSFDFTLGRENVSCFGLTDGSAIVEVTGASPVYTVAWRDENGGVLGTIDSIGNLGAGLYSVLIVDGTTCADSIAFTVSEPAEIQPSFSTDPTTGCRTPNGVLTALPTGGTAPYTYEWTNADGSVVIDTTQIVDSLQADQYQLNVTDDNGCSASSEVILTSLAGPFFDVEILQGDNCGLGEGIARTNITVGTPPYSIEWRTNPLQDDNSSIIATELIGLDTYFVIIVDADSCLQTQEFFMPGRPPLSIDNLESENNYCDLANGEASVSISGGTLPYRYAWTTTPQQTTATASNLVEGPYALTVRDSFNCVIRDTVIIQDEEGFTLDITTTDESCYGKEDGTATAIVDNARGAISYTWQSDPPQRSPQASNLPGGVVDLIVRDAEGCERREFVEIDGKDFLQADFSFQPDSPRIVPLRQATIEFVNESQGAEFYEWNFGDGSTSTEAFPTHTYLDSGRYFIQLKAFNDGGNCVDSILLGPVVVTSDINLYVPTAFTPNGDDQNDFLEVKGISPLDYRFLVFDRFGGVAFESMSIGEAWNGVLPNGRAAPMGVYVYVLTYEAEGGQQITEKGTITLVR
ncbi:MAG: gliding motility-associated C-terminal domain-containing protein [Bacteroidota bacterium]